MAFGTSPLELLAADAMLRGEIYCNSWVYSARWLTGTTSALAANGTTDQVVQITAEADFMCQELNLTAWSAAGTLVQDPDLTILITISSGRPWFNQEQTVRDVCGSFAGGEFPGTLPMPRLVASQSTITVTLANRTGTNWNRVTLAMRGFNIYYQTATRQQVFHVL